MHNFSKFDVPDKDPDFIYRWCNADDRAMLIRQAQGYEPVYGDPEIKTSPVDPSISPGGALRRRGSDLILCRIPKRAFEENVEARRQVMREQHQGTIDRSVEQLNDEVESSLRAQGHRGKGLAFKTTAEPFK
jgi:hypothetical protein